jgi:hypothetical protein
MSNELNINELIHDLKNPLSGMIDSLEHISDMYQNDEDLTNAIKILDQTTKQILTHWDSLNNFLQEGR